MKKRFLLVLAAVFFASVALHAQFIAQMSLLTPHYYPGEVYFKDGHVEEFAEVELPRVGKHKLGVKKNSDDKGHTDIDAADIIGIKATCALLYPCPQIHAAERSPVGKSRYGKCLGSGLSMRDELSNG